MAKLRFSVRDTMTIDEREAFFAKIQAELRNEDER